MCGDYPLNNCFLMSGNKFPKQAIQTIMLIKIDLFCIII